MLSSIQESSALVLATSWALTCVCADCTQSARGHIQTVTSDSTEILGMHMQIHASETRLDMFHMYRLVYTCIYS